MLNIVVNPTAGSGRALKISKKIVKELEKKNILFKIFYTEYAGHATEIVSSLVKDGETEIISIGGDGTSYEVVCGLKDSNASLGIIPAGTGNDFIKSLGIPSKPLEALDFYFKHTPREADVCSVNGQMFLNACGAGFDISVLEYALKAKKYVRGLLPYLYGVIQTAFRFKSTPLKIIADGKEVYDGEALVVAVTNGSYYGGGIKIAPKAKANDGLLDVVFMRPVPTVPKMFGKLAGLLGGKILEFPETSYLTAKQVVIENKGVKFNIDGEIVNLEHAEIKVIPGGIKIHY